MGSVSRASVDKLNFGSMGGSSFSGTAGNSGSPETLHSGRRSGHAGPPIRGGLQPRPSGFAGGGSLAPRGSVIAESSLLLHRLPEHLLPNVVASRAEAGLDGAQDAARQFAVLSQVNKAFLGAVKTALNMQPEVGFAASAARLARVAQDAIQDLRNVPVDTPPYAQKLGQARNHAAAALRGRDHVRVDFDSLRSPEVAAVVVDALAGHAGLRSLEIAVPADFPALAPLMGLLAARPGILRSLDLRATAVPDAPVPGLDPAAVARALSAQKDTLTTLNLANTGLGLEPPLSGAIASLSCLQSLNLSGMPLGASQTQALADTLRPLRSLQDLDLSHSRLDVAACEHLAGVLENHPQLRRLNLGSNLLGDTGALALGPRLATLARLESLDLSGNDIGLEGCRAVAAQLVWRVGRHKGPQAVTSLRNLSLASNALGGETVGHLARALEAIPLLHELNLGQCQIGPAGMEKLAPALKKMTQLRVLNLQSNHLGLDGHSFLAVALRALPNLQDLNLRSTSLGVDGLTALKDALVKLTQLHTLDLGGNRLNREGCAALAPILKKLKQLQTLNLAGIAVIDADGLKKLDPTLRGLNRLQHLDLSNNECRNGHLLARVLKSVGGGLKTLGLEGMGSLNHQWGTLAYPLAACVKLRELNLGNNGLLASDARQLIPALAGLQHLEVLGLHGNALNDGSLSELLPKLGGLRELRSVTVSPDDEPHDPNALQGVLPHVRVS